MEGQHKTLPPDQQPIIYPPYQDNNAGFYYPKKQFVYQPQKQRNFCNSICILQIYTMLMFFMYTANSIMLSQLMNGNLNINAFQYLNAYCPKSMNFIIAIHLVLSCFGTIFYLIQLCYCGSNKYNKISSCTGHLTAFVLIWICLKISTALISTENEYCFFDNFLDVWWTTCQNVAILSAVWVPMVSYFVLNILNFILNYYLISASMHLVQEEKGDVLHY